LLSTPVEDPHLLVVNLLSLPLRGRIFIVHCTQKKIFTCIK
jgi:hypothetical protein